MVVFEETASPLSELDMKRVERRMGFTYRKILGNTISCTMAEELSPRHCHKDAYGVGGA